MNGDQNDGWEARARPAATQPTTPDRPGMGPKPKRLNGRLAPQQSYAA